MRKITAGTAALLVLDGRIVIVVDACKVVSVHVDFPVYKHQLHATFFPKSNTVRM